MKLIRRINWRKRRHLIASGAAHAVIFAAMLIASLWSVKRFEAEASSGMPVDVISMSEFNQMMKATNAPPKPIVEKKAPETKPVQIRDAEISDLPEIVAPAPQAAPPPPAAAPPPEPKKEAEKPPEPKKAEKPPEPKAAEKPPEPVKPDAEALARAALEKQKAEEQKRKVEEQKKLAEQKKREEQKKLAEQKKLEDQKRAEQERKRLAMLAEQKPPSEEKSQFDSSAIQNLLDKRKPRRMAATGDTVNTAPAAPAAGANGPTMTGNDWNRFIARMRDCWQPPDGQDVRNIAVVLRIRMNKDGTLSADPQLVDRVAGSGYQVAADAALRAVKGCAPYTFMPIAKYDHWKDFEINFDPRSMNRG